MPDWDRIRREKDEYRAQLAALSFESKLHILEKLRERAQTLWGSATPASAKGRDPISNLWIASNAVTQQVNGRIHLDILGANAMLVSVAGSRAQSNASATTSPTNAVAANATNAATNPSDRTL